LWWPVVAVAAILVAVEQVDFAQAPDCLLQQARITP
jgi:hypothetical protein